VLGGTSLTGGIGGVGGTLAGAFIIGALANGLNLLEVPSFNQQVVKGLIFIVAVLLDYALKRRLAGAPARHSIDSTWADVVIDRSQ
jgi:ABC-type xylose transport system permease subunit